MAFKVDLEVSFPKKVQNKVKNKNLKKGPI